MPLRFESYSFFGIVLAWSFHVHKEIFGFQFSIKKRSSDFVWAFRRNILLFLLPQICFSTCILLIYFSYAKDWFRFDLDFKRRLSISLVFLFRFFVFVVGFIAVAIVHDLSGSICLNCLFQLFLFFFRPSSWTNFRSYFSLHPFLGHFLFVSNFLVRSCLFFR